MRTASLARVYNHADRTITSKLSGDVAEAVTAAYFRTGNRRDDPVIAAYKTGTSSIRFERGHGAVTRRRQPDHADLHGTAEGFNCTRCGARLAASRDGTCTKRASRFSQDIDDDTSERSPQETRSPPRDFRQPRQAAARRGARPQWSHHRGAASGRPEAAEEREQAAAGTPAADARLRLRRDDAPGAEHAAQYPVRRSGAHADRSGSRTDHQPGVRATSQSPARQLNRPQPDGVHGRPDRPIRRHRTDADHRLQHQRRHRVARSDQGRVRASL